MKHKTILMLLALSLLVATLAWSYAPTCAQTGGGTSTMLSAGYDLTWSTVDGGGGVSTGDGYTLSGTAGQPDAGALNGGGYTLAGGFWGGIAACYKVYLPAVIR